MLKKLTIICIIAMFAFSNAFSNGLSLNNIGGKSLGMAGAYTSVNGDATAIYWNPAGLSFLERGQINTYFTGVMPTGTYKFEMAGIDATTKSNMYPTPGLMAFIPMKSGNFSFGIGLYIPAGLGAEWDGEELKNLTQNGEVYNWRSEIGRIDVTPTVSYKFSDKLAVGVGLNISYGMMDIEMARDFPIPNPETGHPVTWTQYTEESTGMGFGINAGLVYKPTDKMSVGVSFKTQNTIGFEGTASMPLLGNFALPEETDFSRDVAWPMWFGGGISYKLTDDLTFAVDATYSQWSETENEIETSYDAWNEAFDDMGMADKKSLVLHWEDALQLRVGFQYDVNADLTLRVGYYNDPAPAPDETLNILFPSIDYNAFTIGGSYDFGSFGFDLAMEYLAGAERDIPVEIDPETQQIINENMPGIHNMNMIVWTFGFNYYLGD